MAGQVVCEKGEDVVLKGWEPSAQLAAEVQAGTVSLGAKSVPSVTLSPAGFLHRSHAAFFTGLNNYLRVPLRVYKD